MFWDLRDAFLFRLYHGSVGSARFDDILPNFDSVRYQVLSAFQLSPVTVIGYL